jgi:hypothetical protein
MIQVHSSQLTPRKRVGPFLQDDVTLMLQIINEVHLSLRLHHLVHYLGISRSVMPYLIPSFCTGRGQFLLYRERTISVCVEKLTSTSYVLLFFVLWGGRTNKKAFPH